MMVVTSPPAEGGKAKVLRLQATAWADSEFSLDREVLVTSEFGLRTHKILLSYHRKGAGFAPLFLLQFNFTWGLTGDGEWLNFTVRHGDEYLGSLPVQRMRTQPSTDFVSAEPEDFNNLLVWLAMDLDLVAEMHGPDGIVCDFPIPADPQFIDVLRRVRTRMADSV